MSAAGSVVVHVDGIGWCSPGVADWDAARARLLDADIIPVDGRPAPSAGVLPANERRRAPPLVQIACEVDGQACAMAAIDPATTRCVFASMHGDVGITGNLCTTLATNPFEVSPTRFHNSVLNAPAGYWTVATGCHAASNALTAHRYTFAAALFEAALEAISDDEPVLVSVYDAPADGALAELLSADAGFGVAFVLSPRRGANTVARLALTHRATGTVAPTGQGNAIDAAMPLLRALARAGQARFELASGRSAQLDIEVSP